MARKIEGLTLKCPLCGRVCADEELLMVHMEQYHQETRIDADPDEDQEPTVQKKEKTAKCPHCYKRIKEDELDAHI